MGDYFLSGFTLVIGFLPCLDLGICLLFEISALLIIQVGLEDENGYLS